MATNIVRAWAGVGSIRVNSSRSPAMVRTRKSSHHGVACAGLPVLIQTALPASQQMAAKVRMAVCIAICRRKATTLAAISPSAPSEASPCPDPSGPPANRSSPLLPAASGAR